jgi:hypothetical protein
MRSASLVVRDNWVFLKSSGEFEGFKNNEIPVKNPEKTHQNFQEKLNYRGPPLQDRMKIMMRRVEKEEVSCLKQHNPKGLLYFI